MDLPTYTSIWRIEKRLYKLYDFRLPMPLPIGQITVFAAIAVPYVVLLTIAGVPFSHTLVWLYVLPPGAATWLVTRPVLEGKRLPELIKSQSRYLAEPRVWCRMAPLAERDVIVVTGRVWRLPASARAKAGRQPAAGVPAARATAPAPVSAARPVGAAAQPKPPRPVRSPTAPPPRPALSRAAPATPVAPAARAVPPAPASPPAVKVVNAGPATETPPALETALAGPAARRRAGGAQDLHGDSRAGRVTVVPGGHRPGKPDQLQRDRARARLPISGPRRVIVLGCTVGAGQTVVTLLTGEVLASLRSDPVAVLDLNPGAESLALQAQRRPAPGHATSPGSSPLAVLTPAREPDPAQPERDLDPAEALAALERATATHRIVLADPSTIAVTRLLTVADQLVLVAPASAAAARAIGMTFEWLDAHARASLAARAIMVMNGVSRRSMPHVEQAERVCVGRCRAIVRVPWEDQLKTQAGEQRTGLLSPATIGACTALAGVLAAALAGQDPAADHRRVSR